MRLFLKIFDPVNILILKNQLRILIVHSLLVFLKSFDISIELIDASQMLLLQLQLFQLLVHLRGLVSFYRKTVSELDLTNIRLIAFRLTFEILDFLAFLLVILDHKLSQQFFLGIRLALIALVKVSVSGDLVGSIQLAFSIKKIVDALSVALNLAFQMLAITLLHLRVQLTVRTTCSVHRQV